MAPPVTPSPHRFLLDQNRKKAQQPSITRSTQFKQRPSFNFASPATAIEVDSPSSTLDTDDGKTFAATQRVIDANTTISTERQFKKASFGTLIPAVQDAQQVASFETIEDGSQEASEYVMDKQGRVKHEDSAIVNEVLTDRSLTDDEDLVGHSSKRMRLTERSHGPPRSPEQPQMTRSTHTQTQHKFITSPSRDRPRLEEQEQGVSNRQAFFRPSSPVTNTREIDPHLLQFSPHRRGKAYEPGGLAVMMQSHLMDMTSSGSFTLPGRERRRWTITVHSIQSSIPFVLVHGNTEDEQAGKFILAGSRMTPAAGDVVQVQGLTWPCELSGSQLLVCIDWKIVK